MPPTEKLYLDDPYATAFHAKVVHVESHGQRFDVVLDRSFFYPESGGQLADAGQLAGSEVVDVREDESGVVVHEVRAETAPDGDVDCRIDWDRRFDHMQQHTGQHILSRAFIEVAALQTSSFHMGDDACTIDLDGNHFDDAAVAKAEQLANRIIENDRTVSVRMVSIDLLDQTELRRKVPAGVTDVRLVEVEEFDSVPCCGTHVRSTGEVRLLKVLKYEKAKGCHRVHFKAGRRALADYNEKHEIVSVLTNRLTTGADSITAKVDKLLSDGQTTKKAIKQLSLKLAVVERDLLLAGAQEHNGVRVVVKVLADADADYLRVLATRIQEAGRAVVMLAAADGSVVCAASSDTGVSLGFVADLARAMGGSGGGRSGFVQLKLAEGSDMTGFLGTIHDDIKHML